MSESIISKIRLITLGNVHQLLNQLIDLNSIAAVEQYLRDLEEALEDLEGDASEAEGRKRHMLKLRNVKQGELNGLNDSITLILTDGNPANDHLTEAMGVKAVGIRNALQTLEAQVSDATEADTLIDAAVSKLQAKVQAMKDQLNNLRLLEESTKAKERGAAALTAAAKVLGEGEGVNVDNVTARIQERAATADVKLEKALGTMNQAAAEDTQLGEGAAYIEEMRRKLGIAGQQGAVSSAATYTVTVEEAK